MLCYNTGVLTIKSFTVKGICFVHALIIKVGTFASLFVIYNPHTMKLLYTIFCTQELKKRIAL